MTKFLHQVEKMIDFVFACVPRSKPCLVDVKMLCLIAHRGAHDEALGIQENTMAAFHRAFELGCYGIEFDIHASADGILVVNHDSTLKRLWGHDVAIHSLRFDELRVLAPKLPTLMEVVTCYGHRMHLFIELKSPFVATEELARVLKRLTPSVNYYLLSLDETIFPTLVQFPKSSLLLVPLHNNVGYFCELSLQQHYAGVLGHYLLLTQRQINRLHKANQLAGVGFVDSKYSLYREVHRGLHLFFTNKAHIVATCIRGMR